MEGLQLLQGSLERPQQRGVRGGWFRAVCLAGSAVRNVLERECAEQVRSYSLTPSAARSYFLTPRAANPSRRAPRLT